MRRAFAIPLVAAAVAASAGASDLGSIVNSFPARIRINGHQLMAVGIEYAFNDMWVMYYEGVLARRSCETGSVIATYEIGLYGYHGLAFDGSYFWTVFNADLLKLSAPPVSVVASYTIERSMLRHFTWDGSCFWASFLEDKYYAHRMTNTGSIIDTFSIPYIYWKGVAYAGNIPDGPRLFEGAWETSPTEMHVYKMPGREFHYKFLPRMAEPHSLAGCWDGTYLWTFGNWSPGGGEFCFQMVGWEPGIGISPASLGKVKALFK